METELKQLELNDLMATKDVIVLTSLEEQALSWLTSYYQKTLIFRLSRTHTN